MEALRSFVVMVDGQPVQYEAGDDVPDEHVQAVEPGPRAVIFGTDDDDQEVEVFETGESSDQYEGQKVQDLLHLARSRNLTLTSTKKDDVITALREYDASH